MIDFILDNFVWGGDIQQDFNKFFVFLKVLCIFIFVGLGFGIIGGIYNVLMFDMMEKSLRMFVFGSNQFFGLFNVNVVQFENYLMWVKLLGIVGLVVLLLILMGVFLIWKCRKIGFFIYVLGEIVLIFFFIMFMLVFFGMMLIGMLSGIGVGFSIFIVVVFVIMYGVNYKYLC